MKAFVPFVLSLMATIPAFAQDHAVMQERQITESALIDALAPAAPAPAPAPVAADPAAAPAGRTRSIRVRRDEPVAPPPVAAAPARRPKASLLITFETNSAQLTASARRSLDTVAQALSSDKLARFRFGIEGYADPRGGSEANLRLSQERAESVRNYLVLAKGIDIGRLEAVGKGDSELLNKDNPVAAENRRVVIVNLSKM
jgi:outer membrane protein OmpA-like peptidoglycan-associated protein